MFTFENFKKAIDDPLAALLFLLWVNRFFSQAWEDLILNGLINKNEWLYIDIWANDPISGSNTHFFYNKWWRWINIEPNKRMIKKFDSIRPEDTNLQMGVGKSNGELTFYVFNEHQMCTCDKDTVKRYTDAGYKVVDTYTVPIWTLEKVCDTYVKGEQIDILSVDVEWFDMDVLESNNWAKYQPSYIVLETVEYAKDGKYTWSKQNDIFDPYLKNKGYWVVAETGINTIYKKFTSGRLITP
jgi:FkbM family methyltransferase